MRNWYWKTFIIVLAMAIILWIIAIVAAKCFDFYITPDDAVITVIGVVAGFIVIGNYAQVAEMRHHTDKRIKKTENQLETVNKQLEDVKNEKKDLSKTVENFERSHNCIVKKELIRIIKEKVTQELIIKPQLEYSKMNNLESDDGLIYTVHFGEESYQVNIADETAYKIG